MNNRATTIGAPLGKVGVGNLIVSQMVALRVELGQPVTNVRQYVVESVLAFRWETAWIGRIC